MVYEVNQRVGAAIAGLGEVGVSAETRGDKYVLATIIVLRVQDEVQRSNVQEEHLHLHRHRHRHILDHISGAYSRPHAGRLVPATDPTASQKLLVVIL